MKKQKKKMLGISPVIATMLMIVIAIVLLLLIYTWLYAWQQIQTAKETVKIRNVSVDKIRVSGIQLNEVASDEKYVQYLYLNNHSDYDINSVYVFIGAETVCEDLSLPALENLVLDSGDCPDFDTLNLGNSNVLITASSSNGKHAVYINTLLGKV